MDLEEFLRAGDADLPGLVAQVEKAIGLEPDDVLLAVGSLVEGLGTTKSDLDLLLITPRPAERLPADEEQAVVAGRCLADVRILPRVELQGLLDRLHDWSRQPWDVRHASKFPQPDRVLLHRLLHGRFVPHAGQSDPAAVPRPHGLSLTRLKLHVARHLSRTVQVDMAGHRDGGDWASLVYAAQDLLGHAVDALTAAHGITHPNPKWRSRLLEAVPADWEAPLGMRPRGQSAADAVWELHRAPERPTREAALEHALRITTFSRAVFVWAERRLVRGPAPDGTARAWPAVETRTDDAPLPRLDLEVDFLLAEGGGHLARLNSFGGTLRLSPTEFALVLLCDGRTTVREAEAAVCGPGAADGPARVLAARLAEANLSVVP